MFKSLITFIANQKPVYQFVTRHHLLQGLVRRFVAGETLEEAVAAVRELNSKGIRATIAHLGENVVSTDDAAAAARSYIQVLDAIDMHRVDSNISVKLTHLGLDIDDELCSANLLTVVDHAAQYDNFVRIDMESSRYTQTTLAIFERLWEQGYRNVGPVIQAYLYRSEGDVEKLIRMGARVRLCKGAYAEPPSVAFQRKRDVDANFRKLMERLLLQGNYPAIATHDERLVRHAISFVQAHGIEKSRFEFQMLFGVRRDLQESLAHHGYNVRVYVPFGTHWYPYLTRRLAERPANLLFFLRALTSG